MSIKRALGQLEGIQNVDVDLQKGEVHFENKRPVESDRIVKAIESAGYEVISV
jgi:copper chaperone CopZ